MRMTEYSDTTKRTSKYVFIEPTTSSLAIAHVRIYFSNRTAAETYVNVHLNGHRSNPGRSYPLVKTTHLTVTRYYSLSRHLDGMCKCLYTPKMYVHSKLITLGLLVRLHANPMLKFLNSCLNINYILSFTDRSFNSLKKYLLTLLLESRNKI